MNGKIATRKLSPRRFWLAVSMLIGLCQAAHAEFEPGEITFAELNCVACHRSSPEIEQRLAARKSPILGTNGAQLSPIWVRDFLYDPQKEKPGSLMPDMLHALIGSEKEEAAEALTHYVISLQAGMTSDATRFDPLAVAAGNELFHKIGCVACHVPQELPAVSKSSSINDALPDPPDKGSFAALSNSVPLGNLKKKFTVEALADFLSAPLKSRPSGRMPSQGLNHQEARALAMYLLRDQPSVVPASRVPGVNFEHFIAPGEKLPDFAKLSVVSTGYSTNLSLVNVPHTNTAALRFRSLLLVPREGDYTFYTESRDGSMLWLDDQQVVDNDGVHKPTEQEGKIRLTAGEHQLVVTYFHRVGPPVLKVSWAGPGLEKQEIPGTALGLVDKGTFMRPADERPLALDSAKIAKGQQLFEKLNCVACHETSVAWRPATPLNTLAGSKQGCLDSDPAVGLPRYSFTAQQKQDLIKFLTNLSTLQTPLSPADHVRRTMTALDCYACHGRDGLGSPAGFRRKYFQVNGSADLGEEGAIPPRLDGVGAKLKPAWLEKVLVNAASVRPYMATRMPQFGEANVRPLFAALLQADAAQRGGQQPAAVSGFMNGLRLVGNEGLSCIVCHAFAGHPSLGVPALDLATTPERLNPEWFRRYLLEPAKLRPGTRMPTFWPDGVAANKTILDGYPEKQIGAIWSYLASKQAVSNLPPGLIAPKMELVPRTEPLVYRNFIQGAGSRAIGVGFPEKVNLAFDANQVCLALLWHGQFMDPSRHWTGRGEGFQPPLGYNVAAFPGGPPFAVLADANAPWPKETGKTAGYQFRGYVYDAQRRPEFRYQFGQSQVAELFQPIKDVASGEAGFRRKITLSGDGCASGTWFRAAVADKVEDLGHFTYLVGGNIRLAFPSMAGNREGNPASPVIIRQSEADSELLVAVAPGARTAEIVEEISW